ncbi:MAG TPA: M12 family metallo-peptidase, partial [Saprospiraceae bacterium]|nr:M12 family metallo-peptidase [Saprospiraceae bacterium]
MKRLLTLCSFLLLSLIQVSAQTSYSTDLKKKVAQPKVHAIELTAQPLFFDNHQTAVLSEDCQQLLFGQKPRMADLSLTLEGKTYHLLLERFELFSRDAKMELATGEILDLPTIITYRGKVKSPEDSHVTLCISEDQMTLFVSDEHQQFEVHKDKNSMDLRLVVAPQKERALCHTDDEEDMRENNQDPRNSYADCLELYVECDYSSYLDNGSSTPNTQSWMTNIFSNVATIYNDYNVPIIVSQVFIWNTSDVYTAATGVTSMRTAFVNRLISIGLSGKVGYLLSTKDFAGGISYGIGGFCNPITTYPGPAALTCGMAGSIMNYPYNIQNVSHELGHVLGLRHTHACVWNGVNTQIDDCGNVIAANTGKTPEGSNCFNAASPILPGANGTIMSFCSDLA